MKATTLFKSVGIFWSLITLSTGCSNTSSDPSNLHIIGGSETAFNEWNSVVAIKSGDSVCTGVLLDAQTVATAGHCAFVTDETIKELVVEISDPNQDGLVYKIPVQSALIHPGMDFSRKENILDFGVVRMQKPVEIEGLEYFEIASLEDLVAINDSEEKPPVVLVGYGRTDIEDPEATGVKHSVETILHGFTQTEALIGGDQKGGCFGDSGGPAFVKINDKYKVLGITSRGSTCGEAAAWGLIPTVFEWYQNTDKYFRGEELVIAGEYQKALDMCIEAVTAKQYVSDAYLCIGKAYHGLKQPKNAITTLVKYSQQKPLDIRSYELRKQIFSDLGEAEMVQLEEENIQRLGILKGIADAKTYLLNAFSSIKAQNPLMAIFSFSGALKAMPYSDVIYYERAKFLTSVGAYSEAIKDLFVAAKFNPNNPEYFKLISDNFKALGNEEMYKSSLAMMQQNQGFASSQNIFMSAQNLLIQGNIDEALKQFSAAIQLDSEIPLYYKWRSLVYRILAKPELSKQDADKEKELKEKMGA